MLDRLDIRYVRSGTRDLGAADRFARVVVGVEWLAREEAGLRYYRRDGRDGRDHRLVCVEGNPRDHTVGVELRCQSQVLHLYQGVYAPPASATRSATDERSTCARPLAPTTILARRIARRMSIPPEPRS